MNLVLDASVALSCCPCPLRWIRRTGSRVWGDPTPARANDLTSYDAAYLELGVWLGVPLATLDVVLATAAEAEGVPILGSPD